MQDSASLFLSCWLARLLASLSVCMCACVYGGTSASLHPGDPPLLRVQQLNIQQVVEGKLQARTQAGYG